MKNVCLPLFRTVESVYERKLVCAFPERNVHVNFEKESLFAQEKLTELVHGTLFRNLECENILWLLNHFLGCLCLFSLCLLWHVVLDYVRLVGL